MIFRITATTEDHCHINKSSGNTGISKINDYDYSRVVVKKPWGYEYLAFQNDEVAIWILFISNGCQTSMHCHPNKKTALTILSGSAIIETLTSKTKFNSGDALLIDKKVFHTTKSITEAGTLVMETETSTNKKDLIRLKDLYGRTGQGYEGRDHMIKRESEMYYSFYDEGRTYHDIEKKFGECSLEIKKFSLSDGFDNNFFHLNADMVCVLKGSISNPQSEWILNLGDMADYYELKLQPMLKPDTKEIELLLIKKIINTEKL